MNMSLSKLQEIVKDREARGAAVYGVSKEPDTTEQQQKNKTPVSSVLLHYTFGGDADIEGLWYHISREKKSVNNVNRLVFTLYHFHRTDKFLYPQNAFLNNNKSYSSNL